MMLSSIILAFFLVIAILDKGSQLIYASSSKSSFEAIDSFLKDIGEDM